MTFDAGGVSGHSNHIALYAAVRYDSLGDGGGGGFVCLIRAHGLKSKALSHLLSEPMKLTAGLSSSPAHCISPCPLSEKSLSSPSTNAYLLNS